MRFTKETALRPVKVIMWLLLVVVLLLSSLYVPMFQRAVVSAVLSSISSPDGMQISVDEFSMRFPLTVHLGGVAVHQKGDTMLLADRADIRVTLPSILKGQVDVKAVDFQDVFIKIGHPDSSMWLRGMVNELTIDPTELNISNNTVDAGALTLKGGRVAMIINPDTTPPTPPTPVDWRFRLSSVNLSDVDVDLRLNPSFERISAKVPTLKVTAADVDLRDHRIDIASVDIDSVSASLITPAIAVASSPAPENPYPSIPTAISIARVNLTSPSVVYAVAGASPQSGLDPSYLAFSHVDIAIDSIYSRATDLRATLARLSAINVTSGVDVNVSGRVDIDSLRANASQFDIATTFSDIRLNASAGLTDPATAPLDITVDGRLAIADIERLMPSLAPTLAQLPQNRDILLDVDASGTMANLNVDRISAEIPRYLAIKLAGDVKNVDAGFDAMVAHLDIDGHITDGTLISGAVDPSRSSVNIPPLTLSGTVGLDHAVVKADVKATTHDGRLALDALWNNSRQGYAVDLSTVDFPVNSFLPGLGIGRLTAIVKARGHGLDPMRKGAVTDADINIGRIVYNGDELRDIALTARLANSHADINLHSVNAALNADISASVELGRTIVVDATADVANLDLRALGLSDDTLDAMTRLRLNAAYTPRSGDIAANVDVANVDILAGEQRYATRSLIASFASTDTLTTAQLVNRDMTLDFSAPGPIDAFTAHIPEISDALQKVIADRHADIDQLQRTLPRFHLALNAGTDNLLHSIAEYSGVQFSSLSLDIDNDSLFNINARALDVKTADLNIDTFTLGIDQRDGTVVYSANIDNLPGTMDRFAHVNLTGAVTDNGLTALIEQTDIDGRTGYRIGADITLNDSIISLSISPDNPIIDYKQWTVNHGNFITLDTHHRHIDANLAMTNSVSSLRIFTDHDDHARHVEENTQEDINVVVDNVKLQEWISLSPFAPPIKGDLSADIKVALSPDNITGRGTVGLTDLWYGKNRVGDIGLDLDVTTTPRGTLYASTSLKLNDKRVLEAHGNLNDSTAVHPFMLDLSLERFPLAFVNPFVGAETATLDGALNGRMEVTGSMSAPKFDGFLQFDSASVTPTMLGTKLKFDTDSVPVVDNVVTFNQFAIFGVNQNPLRLNGTVDFHHLSDVTVNLALKADDMQLTGSKRRKGVDIYGNTFISLDAKASGNLRFMRASADVTILPGTNVTYIIPGGVNTIESRSSTDMVRFVNFNDSAAVEAADSITPSGMVMSLDAILHIAPGSTIGVDLSTDGLDRLQMQPEGTLDFSMDYMGDTRLTGRLNVNGGYFRYNPPVISQLNFDFAQPSYVTFNGRLLDPGLNVNLTEKVRANVTQTGQNSRLINFIVGLGVTGTLNNMNVAFDLSTDDDITVANELSSMSPEQRANQAMNLLLYGTYTGAGTKASSNISGNPLYSFLETQLNNWMTRNVKAVDISFGFDQYDNTIDGASSTTTSYSYKVSKTFLNDRFKIVVGGNYTTDADPDENLSQNLINDISFEYMLNRTGSMYVRLFRHTGYESILEGEITQTGVGFVYRRKLNSLRNMFRRQRPASVPALPQQGTAITPTSPTKETTDDE